MKTSTKRHWQEFWDEAERLSLDDVYGNDGRIVRELFDLGDVAGKRVLEVGAGSGRDAVALAAAGAEVWTLDYVPGSLDLTARAAAAAGVTVRTVNGDALRKPFDDHVSRCGHQVEEPLPVHRDGQDDPGEGKAQGGDIQIAPWRQIKHMEHVHHE